MLGHCAVLAMFLGLGRLVASAVPADFAAVRIDAPQGLAGTYPGRLAPASELPPPIGKLLTFALANDPSGCDAYEWPAANQSMVLVNVHNCSLPEKVARAEEAGAVGVMLVSDADIMNLTMLQEGTMSEKFNIFVVAVFHPLGEGIIEWNAEHSGDPVLASVSIYRGAFPLLDPTMLLLVALAVSLIVAGAKFATADLRDDSPLAPEDPAQVLEITWWLPALWVLGASVALVVLYFTMKWLIYIVLAMFGFGGAGCMADIMGSCLRYKCPGTLNKPLCQCFKWLDRAMVLSFVFAIGNSAAWFFLRKTDYAWPFQNMIGICFLCFFQRMIRLPSIKTAASLLIGMFFFDIFWVFFSPLFFAKSVMVAVAMGGGSGEVAPMLFRIPAWGYPLESDRMLGYGDIAIPGLLVSFLHRHDIRCYRGWAAGYFLPAVVGYGIGLCCALCALYLMQEGQPALLYLVPGTLGTTLVLACKRGELGALWAGRAVDTNDMESSMLPPQKFCPRGYLLKAYRAQGEGTCDGCQRTVNIGEVVMAASSNYWLCGRCRPRLPMENPPDADVVYTN